MNTSVPVPKPRTQRTDIGKKPIPLPRTQKPIDLDCTDSIVLDHTSMSSSTRPNFFNTLRDEINVKRKTVLETSKQISEEISEKVQERKKSVIETSRQISGDISDKVQEKKRAVIETAKNAHMHVKNTVARRFGSLHRDGSHTPTPPDDEKHSQSLPPSSEIFEGIRFDSPLTLEKKKKKLTPLTIPNRDDDDDIDEDRYSEPPSFPPPKLPPPPLPDESLYDEPQSTTASGSSSSCGGTLSSISLSERLHYEEIFPEGLNLLNYAQQYGNDSDSDKTFPKIESSQVRRSESWSFYDAVNRNVPENIYNNIPEGESIYANESAAQEQQEKSEIDSVRSPKTPPPPERKHRKNTKLDSVQEELSKMNILRLSEISSISVQNSLYENHILQPQPLKANDKPKSPPITPRMTESMIIEFDPLNNLPPLPDATNDLSFLESILQGDTYGTIAQNADNHEWSQSEDESEPGDVTNPPTPPARYDSLPSELDQTPSAKWFVPHPNVSTPHVVTEDEVNNVELKSHDKISGNWMRQRLSDVFQKFVPDNSRHSITRLSFRARDGVKLKVVDRPTMLVQSIVTHQGLVIRFGRSGGVEDLFGDINPRWCYLGNGKLTCYNDNTLKVIKEVIAVESIMSVQMISQNRIM